MSSSRSTLVASTAITMPSNLYVAASEACGCDAAAAVVATGVSSSTKLSGQYDCVCLLELNGSIEAGTIGMVMKVLAKNGRLCLLQPASQVRTSLHRPAALRLAHLRHALEGVACSLTD
jgi:hypothetical protein